MGTAMANRLIGSWLGVMTAAATMITAAAGRQARSMAADDSAPTIDRNTSTSGNSKVSPKARPMNSTKRR
jgi:hypothetical protein